MKKIMLKIVLLSSSLLVQQTMAAQYDAHQSIAAIAVKPQSFKNVLDNTPAGVNVPGVTQSQKEGVEKIIKTCENRYAEVKAHGNKLNNFSVPLKLRLKRSSKNYQNAFNQNFDEFSNFTNSKINIRAAYTSTDAKVIKNFPDNVNAYSSNCSRFADGLIKYVDWVLSGEKDNASYAVIFEGWLKDAK